jgi:hypothetical protein
MSESHSPALSPTPNGRSSRLYYLVLCLLLVLLVWASWFFRYSLHVASAGDSAEIYRLDRWTGSCDQLMYRIPFDDSKKDLEPIFSPILEQ